MYESWKQQIETATSVNEVLKQKQLILDSKELLILIENLQLSTPDQKKELGQALNLHKKTLQTLVDEKITRLQEDQLKDTFAEFDPTFVPVGLSEYPSARVHPITTTMLEVLDIFKRMGFDVQDGPQIVSQQDNFDLVHVPEFHPARDLQDTFFLDLKDNNGKNYVLRTQATSNFPAYAKNNAPPFRVIFPSITFRNETIDATHEVNFHQFDMWMVDKDIAISDLIGLMQYFFREFFGSSDIKVRLRPSFYPFVQPGFDTDIFVPWIKGGVWIEVAGSGPIHKKVLEMNGIDPQVWSGMAWGFGLDRLFMIKNNLNFISQMYTGNLDFLIRS